MAPAVESSAASPWRVRRRDSRGRHRGRAASPIARSQLAVNRKIEQGKLTCSVSDLKANANCPNVLQLQWRLLSDELPFIPGHVVRRGRNERGSMAGSHSGNDEPSLSPRKAGGLRPEVDGRRCLPLSGQEREATARPRSTPASLTIVRTLMDSTAL
jgi:hypothetical protein